MECYSFTRELNCGDGLDNNGLDQLEYRNNEYSKIWAAFNEMREANRWCDAILRSGDGQCFPAHRAILAANSSYFYKYLTASENHGDSNSSTNTLSLTLDKMSGDHVTCILDYMYTRVLKVTMDNALMLLEYADDFAMNGLSSHCIRFLLNSLNTYNCITVWKFSKSHSNKKLLKASRKYILCNFVAISKRNPDFAQLTKDEVMEFVLDDHLNVKTEESVFESIIRWIEHDSESRRSDLPSFLCAIHLGLVKMQYLLDNINSHTYVQEESGCEQIIRSAAEFLCELQKNGCDKVSLENPLVRPRVPTDVLFTFGGWCGTSPICQFETYDTRADRWFNHPSLQEPIPRAYYGLAVIEKNIYILGGYDGLHYFNTNRKFDPIHREWTDLSPMYTKRCYVAAATCNGYIYAMGGFDGRWRLSTVERYEPGRNQWTMCSSMLYKRSDASADTVGGRIYIAGGFDGEMCLATVEMYQPETGQWTICKSMHEPRSGISVIAHSGLLYAIGGFDGVERRATGAKTVECVECYDAERDEWLDATDMNLYRSAFKACVISDLPNVKDYTYYCSKQDSTCSSHQEV